MTISEPFRLGPEAGSLSIFTFKEGLLSKVAHDLELRATVYSIEGAGGELRVSVDPRGIRVLHAIVHGRPSPSVLSNGQREEIEETMRRKILEVRRFPEIVFTAKLADWDGERLSGRLNLHGIERVQGVDIKRNDRGFQISTPLHQPDFRIKPYSALFGALKVKPEIRIEGTFIL